MTGRMPWHCGAVSLARQLIRDSACRVHDYATEEEDHVDDPGRMLPCSPVGIRNALRVARLCLDCTQAWFGIRLRGWNVMSCASFEHDGGWKANEAWVESGVSLPLRSPTRLYSEYRHGHCSVVTPLAFTRDLARWYDVGDSETPSDTKHIKVVISSVKMGKSPQPRANLATLNAWKADLLYREGMRQRVKDRPSRLRSAVIGSQ